MIAYLIKSACCAAVFLLAYLLFLEKEKMHRFNRWYLLASVVLSLVFPLIQLPVIQDIIPDIDSAGIIFFQENIFTPNSAIVTTTPTTESIELTIPLILIAYAGVAGFLFTRFAINLYRLISAAKKHTVTGLNGTRIVAVKEPISSYTFLNTIFISETDLESKEAEILKHEMAHVQQRHSLDILFIEITRIVFWFNPLFIFYKRSIQLNHEFLADEAVVHHCADIRAYQYLLLDRIGLASHLPLGSRFNYSITKKRLQMMTQKTSRLRAMLKQVFVLPVCTACLFAFSTREPVSKPLDTGITPQDTTVKGNKDKWSPGGPYTVVMPPAFFKDIPFTEEGISAQEFKEYTDMQDKYIGTGKVPPREYGRFVENISDAERKRLQELFLKMSREQQHSVRIIFQKSFPPDKKKIPTPEQFARWKDPAQYGIWINGKKADNEELNKYSASDFSHYTSSSLAYTDAQKKYIMKRYNLTVMYKVQLNVMTNSCYDNYYKNGMEQIKKNPYIMSLFWAKQPG